MLYILFYWDYLNVLYFIFHSRYASIVRILYRSFYLTISLSYHISKACIPECFLNKATFASTIKSFSSFLYPNNLNFLSLAFTELYQKPLPTLALEPCNNKFPTVWLARVWTLAELRDLKMEYFRIVRLLATFNVYA